LLYNRTFAYHVVLIFAGRDVLGQHRDRLSHRQSPALQNVAELALRCSILFADEDEVTTVAILDLRLGGDDRELLLVIVPLPETANVDPDDDCFPRPR